MMNLSEKIEALGLTVESVFIPFSQSRNKNEKHKSLNWRVTVKRNGRDVLTTDYSAGIIHCPSYAAKKAPYGFVAARYRSRDANSTSGYKYRAATEREALEQFKDGIGAAECESGFAMELDSMRRYSGDDGNVYKVKRPAAPIMPNSVDVLYSLTMDSDVLEYGSFEEWAENFGYDSDSRNAEKIYLACLEIALKMRAALGDSGMETLREIFQDY